LNKPENEKGEGEHSSSNLSQKKKKEIFLPAGRETVTSWGREFTVGSILEGKKKKSADLLASNKGGPSAVRLTNQHLEKRGKTGEFCRAG